MSTTTREAIVAQAAAELTLLGAGQDAEDETIQYVNSKFDGVAGELSARGVVSFPDDAIPVEISDPLILLLANACRVRFGLNQLPNQEREAIEERIRIMVNRGELQNFTLKVDPSLRSGPAGYSLQRWQRGG